MRIIQVLQALLFIGGGFAIHLRLELVKQEQASIWELPKINEPPPTTPALSPQVEPPKINVTTPASSLVQNLPAPASITNPPGANTSVTPKVNSLKINVTATTPVLTSPVSNTTITTRPVSNTTVKSSRPIANITDTKKVTPPPVPPAPKFVPMEFIKITKKETVTEKETRALAKKICEDLDINNSGALDIAEFDLMS